MQAALNYKMLSSNLIIMLFLSDCEKDYYIMQLLNFLGRLYNIIKLAEKLILLIKNSKNLCFSHLNNILIIFNYK